MALRKRILMRIAKKVLKQWGFGKVNEAPLMAGVKNKTVEDTHPCPWCFQVLPVEDFDPPHWAWRISEESKDYYIICNYCAIEHGVWALGSDGVLWECGGVHDVIPILQEGQELYISHLLTPGWMNRNGETWGISGDLREFDH